MTVGLGKYTVQVSGDYQTTIPPAGASEAITRIVLYRGLEETTGIVLFLDEGTRPSPDGDADRDAFTLAELRAWRAEVRQREAAQAQLLEDRALQIVRRWAFHLGLPQSREEAVAQRLRDQMAALKRHRIVRSKLDEAAEWERIEAAFQNAGGEAAGDGA